jgi:hypothetical protein
MIVYNYTKIQRREKRVYSLFNTTISQQGLSMGMIKTSGGVLAIFTVLGLLFCLITGKMWYSPLNLANSSSVGYFYLVFVILPVAIGIGLNSYKIQNYRAIDYIKLYIQPKKPLNQHGKVVKLEGFKINSFVERL